MQKIKGRKEKKKEFIQAKDYKLRTKGNEQQNLGKESCIIKKDIPKTLMV